MAPQVPHPNGWGGQALQEGLSGVKEQTPQSPAFPGEGALANGSSSRPCSLGRHAKQGTLSALCHHRCPHHT